MSNRFSYRIERLNSLRHGEIFYPYLYNGHTQEIRKLTDTHFNTYEQAEATARLFALAANKLHDVNKSRFIWTILGTAGMVYVAADILSAIM